MRNALLLSRPATATPPQPAAVSKPIPSIRLITATPSATGISSEASTSVADISNSSWASVPSPLGPRVDVSAPRKRLVPKKSKLSLLGVGSRDKDKDKAKDLSDVVRRVGGSASTRGGFEIYVDPTDDPELGEILVVKKKKSRAGLDGMNWGTLGEVTNVPSVTPKEPMLKVKTEEKDKWWSIGRGRKDSKDKTKESKEKEAKEAKSREKSKTRVKCTCLGSIPSQPNSPTSQPLPCVR